MWRARRSWGTASTPREDRSLHGSVRPFTVSPDCSINETSAPHQWDMAFPRAVSEQHLVHLQRRSRLLQLSVLDSKYLYRGTFPQTPLCRCMPVSRISCALRAVLCLNSIEVSCVLTLFQPGRCGAAHHRGV